MQVGRARLIQTGLLQSFRNRNLRCRLSKHGLFYYHFRIIHIHGVKPSSAQIEQQNLSNTGHRKDKSVVDKENTYLRLTTKSVGSDNPLEDRVPSPEPPACPAFSVKTAG